jgi:hypothetical protein
MIYFAKPHKLPRSYCTVVYAFYFYVSCTVLYCTILIIAILYCTLYRKPDNIKTKMPRLQEGHFGRIAGLEKGRRDLIWDYMAHISLGEPRAMFSMVGPCRG